MTFYETLEFFCTWLISNLKFEFEFHVVLLIKIWNKMKQNIYKLQSNSNRQPRCSNVSFAFLPTSLKSLSIYADNKTSEIFGRFRIFRLQVQWRYCHPLWFLYFHITKFCPIIEKCLNWMSISKCSTILVSLNNISNLTPTVVDICIKHEQISWWSYIFIIRQI